MRIADGEFGAGLSLVALRRQMTTKHNMSPLGQS
jgi:hypothetical protein